MEVVHAKIKKKGEIEIPANILKKIGLKVGEEVELKLGEGGILVKPTKSVVDELTGLIKAKSKLVDEVVENEELYEF